jgi:CheY-like chemotaxis protein
LLIILILSVRFRTIGPQRPKRIPIVAATSHGDVFRPQCLDSGMDDILTKPLMMDVLKATLDKYAPLKPVNKTGH